MVMIGDRKVTPCQSVGDGLQSMQTNLQVEVHDVTYITALIHCPA